MKINSVIIATALLSPLAMAAPHSASGIILTYDLDGNEKLSLEEFVDARRQRFAPPRASLHPERQGFCRGYELLQWRVC